MNERSAWHRVHNALPRLSTQTVIAATCFISCLGCDHKTASKPSPRFIQVAGRVTLDQQPLARSSVLFVPVGSGSRARGLTNDTGDFRLLDESEVAGIKPGEYIVVFRPLVLPTGKPSQSLDKDYRSAESTPVRVTINQDTTVVNFQLTMRASDFRIES